MASVDTTITSVEAEFTKAAEPPRPVEGARPTLEEAFARSESTTAASAIPEYPAPEAEVTAPGATEARDDSAAAEKAAKDKRRKHLKQLFAYTTAAAVVSVALIMSTVAGQLPLRKFLAQNPNWYSAEYDMYLHFADGYGWVFHDGAFQRVFWDIEGEGTDEEHLMAEFVYSYFIDAPTVTWASCDYTTEVAVVQGGNETETGPSLTCKVDIGDGDADPTTTFVPVKSIPVDASVVERFGTMSGQEMLEAIGTFVAVNPSDGSGASGWINLEDFTALTFAGGNVSIGFVSGQTYTVGANYHSARSDGLITSPATFTFPDGSSATGLELDGLTIIREDGIHFYLDRFMWNSEEGETLFAEFVPAALPDITPDEPDTPSGDFTPDESELDPPDEAFPTLPNLWPDTPVPPYGSLGEYYVIFDNEYWLVSGDAADWGTAAYPGASYDPATNTLTLTNCTADFLEVNWMGNGFTINLVGENHLGGLMVWGFYSGGSVTLTGTGSLTINEGGGRAYGILMLAEESQTCLMVDRGVTLDVSGSDAAIIVEDTMLEKAIYYLTPLRQTGGVRAVIRSVEEDGIALNDYSIVDENGEPAKHVHIAPR